MLGICLAQPSAPAHSDPLQTVPKEVAVAQGHMLWHQVPRRTGAKGRLKESECDLALGKGVSFPMVYRKLKETKGPGAKHIPSDPQPSKNL